MPTTNMTRAEILALAEQVIFSSEEAMKPMPTGTPGIVRKPDPAVVYLATGLRDVALALRAIAEGMNDDQG